MAPTPARMKVTRSSTAVPTPQKSTRGCCRGATPKRAKMRMKTKTLSTLSPSSIRYPARYCCAASEPRHSHTTPPKASASAVQKTAWRIAERGMAAGRLSRAVKSPERKDSPGPPTKDKARCRKCFPLRLTGSNPSGIVSLFIAVTILSRRFLYYSAGACLGLLWGSRAVAQVAETSPFFPAGSASGPNGPEGAALELRGIMTTSDGTRFCIYDPVKKSGIWSGVNERGNAFVIKSADLAHDAVMVQTEGRTLKLVLHQAKVGALGAAEAPRPPQGPRPW